MTILIRYKEGESMCTTLIGDVQHIDIVEEDRISYVDDMEFTGVTEVMIIQNGQKLPIFLRS